MSAPPPLPELDPYDDEELDTLFDQLTADERESDPPQETDTPTQPEE